MEIKHSYVNMMLDKAMMKIDGNTMYDGRIIEEMNKNGVFFHFTDAGVYYQFTPYSLQ